MTGPVYDTSSVDAAVTSLTAVIQDAMQEAVPCGFFSKSKFPYCFSSVLILRYRRFKKKKSDRGVQ
jgi:hypothetical protein